MQDQPGVERTRLTQPVTTPPIEDAGARTIGYYEFQFGCVATFCLQMDVDNGPAWIVCEWHTDFIVGWADQIVPVSVKHREADTGRWTIATLFTDGGMKTMFDRWNALGKPRECRWMTNGGLDTDSRTLQRLCSEGSSDDLHEIANLHAWRFSEIPEDEVYEFFCALRIEQTGTEAASQRVLNIERFMRPTLNRLGLPTSNAGAAYDEVVSLVRAASSGHADAVPETWMTMSPGSQDASHLAGANIERRIIHGQDIDETLRRICWAATATGPRTAPSQTTLAKKLRKGELGSTAQASAARTRMHWTSFEAAWSEPLPSASGPSDIERLRVMLVNRAAEVQITAAQSGEPYGNAMYMGLRAEARRLANEAGISGLTDDLIMGLAYDLTAACEIWWSPSFDVAAEEPAVAHS